MLFINESWSQLKAIPVLVNTLQMSLHSLSKQKVNMMEWKKQKIISFLNLFRTEKESSYVFESRIAIQASRPQKWKRTMLWLEKWTRSKVFGSKAAQKRVNRFWWRTSLCIWLFVNLCICVFVYLYLEKWTRSKAVQKRVNRFWWRTLDCWPGFIIAGFLHDPFLGDISKWLLSSCSFNRRSCTFEFQFPADPGSQRLLRRQSWHQIWRSATWLLQRHRTKRWLKMDFWDSDFDGRVLILIESHWK